MILELGGQPRVVIFTALVVASDSELLFLAPTPLLLLLRLLEMTRKRGLLLLELAAGDKPR